MPDRKEQVSSSHLLIATIAFSIGVFFMGMTTCEALSSSRGISDWLLVSVFVLPTSVSGSLIVRWWSSSRARSPGKEKERS